MPVVLTTEAVSQDVLKQYVNQNAIPVKSILPASPDAIDLEAIGAAIGDAKVVMLGENDHGDAPTFLAKTRLIKYLHEQKGFNVLAFESDFFALNFGWPMVAAGQMTVDSLIYKSVYPLWSRCNTVQPLIKEYLTRYLQEGRPLVVAGVDNQVTPVPLVTKLDSFLRAERLPITLLQNYGTEIVPMMKQFSALIKDTVKNNVLLGYWRRIRNEIATLGARGSFWALTVDNMVAFDQELLHYSNYYESSAFRDRQMATNLKWLSEVQYPGEKIIVWAANYHVSKYNGHYKESFLNNAATMGGIFTNDTARLKSTYILGFTCFEGEAGRIYPPRQYKVPGRKSNSFESWLNAHHEFAFVDFKKFNSDHPEFHAPFLLAGGIKGGNSHAQMEANWNHIFDGVFFIRNMYRCTKID